MIRLIMVLLLALLIGCGDSSGNDTNSRNGNNHNNIDGLYKTGEVISYASGDDGELQKGLPKHFVDEGDIIYEETKNIYWQNNAEIKTFRYNHSDAKLYCESLSLGGYNDWRLPTLYELQEIIDYSKFNFAFDNSFQFNKNGYIWSSTPCSVCAAKSFAVAANSGEIHRFENDNEFSVRCVRGNKYSKSKYHRDDTKKIVIDDIKKLMWQDGVNKGQNSENRRTLTEALDYCNNLDYAGYSDWRVPNVIELRSLFDFTNGSRAISLEFKMVGHENGLYWSSTTDAANNNNVWTIDIYHGESETYDKSSIFYTRCVRDIKSINK